MKSFVKRKKIKNKIFLNFLHGKSSSCSTPQRPISDYIKAVFSDFIELHGDRQFADDQSIIGGIAEIEGNSVMVIGMKKEERQRIK